MQFRDLHAQYEALKQEIDAGIQAVIESTGFILGKPVAELEEKLASYVGRKHCVGVANGTEALQLSLMAYDVGPGDAVFTSDFTYFASAGCASIIGATPVMVDIDLNTFNMSPAALEKQIQRVLAEGKLTPKFIIPVDLFGLPANYPEIETIAAKYGLRILEDAAQRQTCLFLWRYFRDFLFPGQTSWLLRRWRRDLYGRRCDRRAPPLSARFRKVPGGQIR